MARLPEKDFTGREIASLLNLSHTAVQDAMKVLVAGGLVNQRVIGRAHVFRTNKQSYLYGIIRELVAAEERLEGELLDELKSKLGGLATSLVVFGSHARGAEHRGSDLDLLVITERTREAEDQLSELQVALLRRYGIYLDAKVWTPKQLRTKKSLPYIRAARKEGIAIFGQSLEEVIGAERQN